MDELSILMERFYDCKRKLEEIKKCRIVDVAKCKNFDFVTYLKVSKLFEKTPEDVLQMPFYELYTAIGAFCEGKFTQIWLELHNKA